MEKFHYKEVIENIDAWLWTVDANGIYTYCSEGIYELLGFTPNEVIGKTVFDFMSPQEANRVESVFIGFISNREKIVNFKNTNIHKDGSSVILETSAIPILDESGNFLGYEGIDRDITSQYVLNEEVNHQHETLSKLTQHIPGFVYQFRFYPDGHTSFPYASDGIKELYEVEPQDIMDDAQPVFDRIHSDDVNMMATTIQYAAENLKEWHEEFRVDLPKKGVLWLEGFSKPEKLEDGSILWHGYSHKITDRKNAEKKLAEQKIILDHQAHHDALTGLPNRLLFHDRLSQAIEKAKRNNSKIALLFIDLDHFKEINDSLGHDIGDEVLKEVTSRLIATIRDSDTAARLGGDEFIVILEDISQGEDASYIATKILENLAKPIKIKDNILYVSSSIGISICPEDGITVNNLLKFADSAMYKAKDEGRNNFQYYNS